MLFKHKSNAVIGLDISSGSIKLLELKKNGDKLVVQTIGKRELPPEVIIDKTIRNEEVFSENLKILVDTLKPTTTNAAITIPDSSVMTKIIQLDKEITGKDLEEQVTSEAEKHIPYPLDEVSLDFSIIGESHTNPDTNDILLVASRTETIDLQISAIEKSGIKVKVVDVHSLAIERASSLVFQQQEIDIEDKILAIFDIGVETNLTIACNNLTIFTREDQFGSGQLISEIQDRHSITREEAVQKLHQDRSPEFTNDVLNPFVETTMIHIRRALQMFYSGSQHDTIHHMVITGGVTNIPGLVDHVQEQLGVPTMLANPLLGMQKGPNIGAHIDFNTLGTSYLLCSGLALRSFD